MGNRKRGAERFVREGERRMKERDIQRGETRLIKKERGETASDDAILLAKNLNKKPYFLPRIFLKIIILAKNLAMYLKSWHFLSRILLSKNKILAKSHQDLAKTWC